MLKNNIKKELKIIFEVVKEKLSCSAHNIDHIERVYNICLDFSKKDKRVNKKVLLTAALLHDIARIKEDNDNSGLIDHAVLGAKEAAEILVNYNYSYNEIECIKKCIISHRSRTDKKPSSIEAKYLYDADKIDAIGAIGIARCFMLAGQHNERLYSNEDLEVYKKRNITSSGRIKSLSNHAPNLEYKLKLKKIPEKLHTDLGRKFAKERMEVMSDFFEKLDKEMSVGGINE